MAKKSSCSIISVKSFQNAILLFQFWMFFFLTWLGWFFKGPYRWSTPKAWDREETTEAWAAALQVLDLARASCCERIEELGWER